MKKTLLLILFVFALFPTTSVFAAPPEIEKFTVVPVEEIQLRPPLELEQAAMEYMLAFEAWVEARRSKEPETRNKIVVLMKEYRESYAKFLRLLREDKLYDPQKPKNPAGWYNQKREQSRGNKVEWKQTGAASVRKQVKEMVKRGAKPEEVKAFIKASLPKEAMSRTPDQDTPTAVDPNDTVNNPEENTDDDEIDTKPVEKPVETIDGPKDFEKHGGKKRRPPVEDKITDEENSPNGTD